MALPTQLAHFDVLAKLSAGGMGEVLLARRLGLHGFEKLVALKTIRTDLHARPDIRSMFLDEARLVARLDHPCIAQVHDFGAADGTLYIAMEYVAGIAINKLLAKRLGRGLPPTVAAQIVERVARGLDAAHELRDASGQPLGVVHRDVTPGNLILTFDGHVKILDFGIAHAKNRESPHTEVGELKGKPSYMAPEQLRGEPVDRRADIYALCVVLHELLTGQKLFSKDNIVATALAVERGAVRPPSERAGPLPAGLDELVMAGLAHRPEDRPPTARAVADALSAIVKRQGAGDELERFARETLAPFRKAHEEWLLHLREDAAKNATGPRPRPPSHSPYRGSSMPSDEPTVTARPAAAPAAPPPAMPRPRRWSAWVAALLIIVFAGLGAWAGRALRKPARAPVSPAPLARATPPAPATSPAPAADAPVVDAAPPKAATAAPEPRRRRRRRTRPSQRRAAQGPPGRLTIGARPFALVRLDGEEIGATPILDRAIAPGRHVVELVAPETGEVRLRRALRVTPGGRYRITDTPGAGISAARP